MSARQEDPSAAVRDLLEGSGLVARGEPLRLTEIGGGVSGEIWRVDLPGTTLCVKRALARLRVEADWFAPVSRNRVEHEWLTFAGAVCPGHVPRVLAYDDEAGLFAMAYLEPSSHPVWKSQLLDGRVDVAFAGQVGDLLARLHAGSAADAGVCAQFATDENFEALRIEPYLRATARVHPDLAPRLAELAASTAACHLAVVHGDVSPKNILVGPSGPVLLDAECAWFGDPAFDLAFCLNHLLLKSVALPHRAVDLYDACRALADDYARGVDWEPWPGLLMRATALLPALALARVDGASPVDYLSVEDQDVVRTLGRDLVSTPEATLEGLLERWSGPAPGAVAED